MLKDADQHEKVIRKQVIANEQARHTKLEKELLPEEAEKLNDR